MRLVLEMHLGPAEPAITFNETIAVCVYENVGHGRVLEQRLNRPKSDHLVEYLVGEFLQFFLVEGDIFGAHIIGHVRPYLLHQLRARQLFQEDQIEFVDQTGRRKVKGNMDIELAVDAMEIAPHIDQMVLFSGDGDFRSLVEAVQRRGVRVIVVSTISTQPPMVADELRRQADQFVDILELQSKIGRDPAERPAREPREGREPREPRHTPQFLQRSTTAARVEVEADDEFEDD